MRIAFVKTLCELARQDPRLWLVTGDLGFSALEPFRDEFPERFVNAGVCEQNMTGLAAGLAHSGYVVFTYSIANFPTLRCLEQIRNDVCYHELPVKVVAVGGGFAYGAQGFTHHGVEELAVLRALPGMTVVAPADPMETTLAVRAVARAPGPCYLRLGKAGEPAVHQSQPHFALGEAITVRDGTDVTLIATGTMVHVLSELLPAFDARGISVRLLSMHTVKPLDAKAVQRALQDTHAVVTVEEHREVGGLGSAVADVVARIDGPRCPFRKIALPDAPSHAIGSQSYLRAQLGDIVAQVAALVETPC